MADDADRCRNVLTSWAMSTALRDAVATPLDTWRPTRRADPARPIGNTRAGGTARQ
jgi:hypothetical protein